MTVQTMTCETLLNALSDYVDGELRADLSEALERHMAECRDCRIVVDTTRKTISLVQSCAESDLPLPGEVRERLFNRLERDAFRKPDPS